MGEMSCSICNTRKEKRFCPAVHGRICPTCCGTEREVTLDCPSDCPYLQQARRNESTRDLHALDREAWFPQVEVPANFLYEHEPLLGGMSFGVARVARADRSLHDPDVIAALTAMAKTYETLVNSGLHYESPVAHAGQQAVIAELQKMLAEYRAVEEKHRGYSTLRDSEMLKSVVYLLRLAIGKTSGRPRSRAFLDFVSEQFPEQSSVTAGPEGVSRIIMP
jgi:hypothetical protein